MKNQTIMAITSMVVLCLATTVMAQPPGKGGERGQRGQGAQRGEGGQRGQGGQRGSRDMGRMMQAFPVMAALDANQDGVISSREIQNASAALSKLDKNGNGDLDADELRPQFGGRGQGGPGEGMRSGPGGGGVRGAGDGPPEGGGRGQAGKGGKGQAGGGKGQAGGGGKSKAGGGDMQNRLMQADKNGDGKLAKDEVPERMAKMFDRIDQNADGFIDKDEMANMAKMRGGSGGRPGGSAGRGGKEESNPGGGVKPKRPGG